MASDKLIFPIGFDLKSAVDEAAKDWPTQQRRLEQLITQRQINMRLGIEGANLDVLDKLHQGIKSLTECIARLNGAFDEMRSQMSGTAGDQGRVTVAAEGAASAASRQVEAQRRVTTALRDTAAEQAKVKSLLDRYNDTYENQIDRLARLTSQLAANKKAQSDNEKALSQGLISAQAYGRINNELLAQSRQLTAEKRALTQILTAEEKAMMAQEGSYTNLSQQLSLLKTAFKELGEEGRASQFGQELEGAIQSLDAQLKGMAADMGEFQRNVGNYSLAGQNGVVATESLTAALNQEARTTQDLIDQTRILEEAKRMLNTSDANYTSTLDAINAKLEENKRKLSDVSDILGKDAKSVAEAEAQNKRLSEALKHVDLTTADAKKRLEEIRAQIERNNKTIATATGANEKYADSMLGLVGINANFGSSLQSLGQGGSFIDGLKTKVQAFGKTLMGLLSNPVVLGFLGVAGVVAGFKWWYDYNKGLIEASRLTENFTGLSGEAADKVTADMQALADHMGQGYDKTISAANVLVQQFGVSWKDAMQLMEDGITAGADMSGNMVSNIERFAPALRDAGVSADEFMSILSETRNGIFNEQGISDIVKGGTRLRAMTKQIATSLDAVGISSEQLQKDLSDGTLTMFQAVQKVAAKLKELPENSQEAGNIMKQVFGRTAAEGGTLLIQSIADVNTNLDVAKERMGELGEANEVQMNAQKELNEALSAVFKMSGTSFEVMTTRAKTFVTQGITKIIRGCVDIVNWFIRMYNKSIVVRGAVNSIANSFNTLKEIARFVLNQIVDTFKAAGTLIEGIVTLDWDKVKQGWSDGMSALGNNVVTLAKNIASNTADAFNKTLNDEMKEVSINLNADGIDTAHSNKPSGTPGTITPIETLDTKDKKAAETYLQTLNKIEQSITAINTKYGELVKKEGNTKAVEHINELYKTQLAYINELGKQFGLSFQMPTTFKDLQGYRSAILDVINLLKASGIKGADGAALELEMKIGLGNVDDLRKSIEKEISAMSDKISRTKVAKEFYNKVFSQTGNHTIAAKVTASIYGSSGEDLEQQITELIQKYFAGVEIPLPINLSTGDVDYKALRDIWEADKALPDTLRKIPAEYDAAIKQILENGDNFNRKQAEQWLKDLETAKTFSDKRIELAQYTANQIAEIERKRDALGEGNDDLRALYDTQIAGYKAREQKEAAKLSFEAFKEMPIYTQMFADLDNASSAMLTNMREQILQMKGAWKDLDPTELKELQDRISEIDAQLASRNPFKTLADSFKEYRELRKSGTKADADKAFLDATKAYAQAKADLEKLLAEKPTDDPAVENARQLVNSTEESAKKAQELAERWARVEKAIGLSSSQIFSLLGSLSDVAAGIGKVTQVFGGSEEDVKYWDDIAAGLNEVTSGIQNMVQAAMSGNPIGIVTSAITAIPNMISGFANLFSASKVKKANKEIKRQQQILEQLEYSYNRLTAASDKLFGVDYINNYNQQLRNLQAQQAAYEKQAQAERSKGKKEDKAKTEEYLKAARDTADQIKELEADLTSHFTGTNITSAARDFAKAWLDAKASFSSTTDAMKSKFKDLVQNMIIEGAAARIIENALSPLWDKITAAYKSSDPERALEEALNGMDEFIDNADKGMEIFYKSMKAKGYDLDKVLGDSSGTKYTGIAKEIATASEESINGLAAGVNTQNFYMAQQLEEVRLIRARLYDTGTPTSTQGATSVTNWDVYHSSYMNQLESLNSHAAGILSECRRAAIAAENTANYLRRVVIPKGSSATHGVNIYLKN